MIKKKSYISIYAILVILLMASCTPQKELMYFQTNDSKDTTSVYKYTYPQGESNYSPTYLLKERDVLYIQIKSSVDAESNKLFSDQNSYYSTQNESGIYLNSYVIDKNGEINLPVVGKIK